MEDFINGHLSCLIPAENPTRESDRHLIVRSLRMSLAGTDAFLLDAKAAELVHASLRGIDIECTNKRDIEDLICSIKRIQIDNFFSAGSIQSDSSSTAIH